MYKNIFTTFIFTLFLSSLVAIQAPTTVFACSCIQPGTPAAELKKFDAVFRGTVVELEDDTVENTGAGTIIASFDVSEYWKGDVASDMTVQTSDSSAACGVTFVKGEEYIVYANEEEGELSTYLCSRTATAENAAADFKALGNGTIPEDRLVSSESSSSSSSSNEASPSKGGLKSDAYAAEWRASDQIVLAVSVANLILILLVLGNQLLVFRNYKKGSGSKAA